MYSDPMANEANDRIPHFLKRVKFLGGTGVSNKKFESFSN